MHTFRRFVRRIGCARLRAMAGVLSFPLVHWAQEVVAALQDTVLSNAEQLASLQRAAGRTAAAEAAAEAATATATALGQWQTRYNTLTM
jgi:hypothetical protein